MVKAAGSGDAVRPELADLKILHVDDTEAALLLMRTILGAEGYRNVHSLDDARAARAEFLRLKPDLLLLDLHMPGRSGFEVLDDLRDLLEPGFPVLMLTSDVRPEVREDALRRGVRDFLNKPYSAAEVRLRIHNMLELRHLQKQLLRHNEQLEETVRNRTTELEQAQLEMVTRLARAAEHRDGDTGEHIWRAANYCAVIAARLGLSRDRVELLRRAAPLHDVGKLAIPDGILMKPGRLTATEFQVMREHAQAGAELLSGGRSKLTRLAETIARTHHERWDGQGYPDGLRGTDIPVEARILAVADAFDALTHDRSYRKAVSPELAVLEITRGSGTQFDPEVVEAFREAFSAGELVVAPEEPVLSRNSHAPAG